LGCQKIEQQIFVKPKFLHNSCDRGWADPLLTNWLINRFGNNFNAIEIFF
jgi:hypothetical protein